MDKIKMTKKSLILFLVILFGYILCDVINKSLYNTRNELARLAILFLPLLITAEETKHKLLKGSYIGITIASLIGLAAYANIIPKYDFAILVDGVFRLQAIFGYANTAAVFFGIGVMLAFHYSRESGDYRFLHQIFLGVNLLSFILTLSRLSFACFFASLLLCIFIKYKNPALRISMLSIAGIIVIAGLFMDSYYLGSTLAWRFIYWQDGFKLFLENILGKGNWQENQYFIQTANYSVKYLHNGFLQLAIDGGIFALSAFILLLFSAFKNLLTAKNKLYLLCILVFITLHGFFDIDFSFGGIFLILGIVISFSEGEGISIKRPFVVSLSALIILSAIFSSSLKTPVGVSDISGMFSRAYSQNDYEGMYALSKKWLVLAPRQQNAYDAYYVSLTNMMKNNSDEKYRHEMQMLYGQALEVNKTMNPLTRYLAAHKKIVLPEYN